MYVCVCGNDSQPGLQLVKKPATPLYSTVHLHVTCISGGWGSGKRALRLHLTKFFNLSVFGGTVLAFICYVAQQSYQCI